MVKRVEDAEAHKLEGEPVKAGGTQKPVVRPKGGAAAWTTVNKLPDRDKKMSARRKVPFGPLGGSGRKTNRSRSS